MRMVTLSTVCLSLVLSGCLVIPQPAQEAQPETTVEVPKVVYEAAPGLTPKERWKKAITHLEVGESGQARAELVAFLREKPTSNRARDLIKQIDSDPVAYLGEKHFLHRMERGESLSIVAKRMLGDALKFHVLARYNEIDNPRQMTVGQVIKVPGDKPPPAPEPQVAEENNEAVETDILEAAGEDLTEGDEAKAEDTGGFLVLDPEPSGASGESDVAAVDEVVDETVGDATIDGGVFTIIPAAQTQSEENVVEVADNNTQDGSEGIVISDGSEGAEASTELAVLPAETEEAPQTEDTIENTAAASIERLMEEAVAKVQQGDYAGAGDAYEEAIELYPDDDLIKQMAALNYLTYADTLEGVGDRDKASLVLARAKQLDPRNAEVEQRLGRLSKLDDADAFYQEGAGHQAKGELIAAYGAFQKAVNIVPDHSLANKKLLSLTPAVAEAYYRKGIKAFRKQDLDEAIQMYDECLSVDPSNSSCSVKRIETVELKKKLEDTFNQ